MEKSSEQTDSSSSEDEVSANILKEAVDKEFLNNSLYSKNKVKAVSDSERLEVNKTNAKSLRSCWRQEDEFTSVGISSSSQIFIAKKLREVLEKVIQLQHVKDTKHSSVVQRQIKDENSGIKLLSSSENFLTTNEICVECKEKPKKRKKCQEIAENDEDISKFREAAVDSEHILSKSDTKSWTSKRPEPDFKYKMLKNGILVEQQ